MRKYSLTTIALSAFLASYGQAEFKFGAIAGGNYSTWTSGATASTTINGTPFSGELTPSGMFGYQFGGLVRYEKDDWGVEFNLLYTSRSAKWHGTVTDAGSNDVRLSYEATLKQIQLPIMGVYKFEIAEKTDFRFNLGLYASYGIGKIDVDVRASDTPGSVAATSGKYTWSEFGLRKLNFGALGGAGVDYTLEGSSRIGIELRAQTTFNDMRDKLSPAFDTGGNKVGLASVDLLVSYVF